MVGRDVHQVPDDVPEDLKIAIGEFVSYHNFQRYHEALGEVTPADVLAGGRN